jgi:VIT1/CCC1 family predicted Fe2+/Mn2+ transporter
MRRSATGRRTASGKAPLRAGARQLLVGGGAAVVVYVIGHAIGHGAV